MTKAGPEKAQMTIFYGGQVIVFNDFPADKAKEIMLLASNGGTTSVAPKLPESPATVPKVVPCFVNQRPPQQIASGTYFSISCFLFKTLILVLGNMFI